MRGVLGLVLIVGGFTVVVLILTGHLSLLGMLGGSSSTNASTGSGASGAGQSEPAKTLPATGSAHTVSAGATTGGNA